MFFVIVHASRTALTDCGTSQDDNSYLEGDMVQKGYFLTCSSYPKADVTIKTNQEDNVFD